MNKYNKYNYTLKIIMIFFKNCYFEFEYESQFSELPHRLHHQTNESCIILWFLIGNATDKLRQKINS